jgi:hypothetical protein
MKIFYIFLLASTFCFCSSKNSHIEEKVKIETFVKGVYEIPRDGGGSRFFLIGLKLLNISQDSIEFVTMTCATGANLVFDTNEVEPVVNNCSSNSATQITLKSNQEFDFTFLLKANNTFSNRLKIGWVLFNRENTHNVNDLYKFRENLENVIWANPIELDCCAFRQYEIK